AVQLHAFADEALALAHAAVGLGIAQLFGGEHTGHAVIAPGCARKVVIAAQGRAHLGGQRVVEGLVEVGDLNLRRISLPASTAGGDDADLAPLAPGNQRRFGGHAVDAVDNEIQLLSDVLSHGLAGDEISHRVHLAGRVDGAQPFSHYLDLGPPDGTVQCMKLAVGVGDAHVVQVEQADFANARTHQCFGGPGADPTNADDRN